MPPVDSVEMLDFARVHYDDGAGIVIAYGRTQAIADRKGMALARSLAKDGSGLRVEIISKDEFISLLIDGVRCAK